MASRIVAYLSSFLLILVALFLFFLTWSTGTTVGFIGDNHLLFTFFALLLFAIGLTGFNLRSQSVPSFSFQLLKGKGTVSLAALKKGIEQFFLKEEPTLQLASCRLSGGGKHLELELVGIKSGSPPQKALENLSSLLADQYGFDGQLDIYFKEA